MDITVHHPVSGRCCVVRVEPGDTIRDVKSKALSRLSADRSAVCLLSLRLQGNEAPLDDALGVSVTPLEQGTHVELVRVFAQAKTPCLYREHPGLCATALALSPCGRWCAVLTAADTGLWDTTSGTLHRTLPHADPAKPPQALSFSPAAGWLAAAGALLSIYDTTAWQGHTSACPAPVSCVVWGPCGERLVCGTHQGNMHVWDVGRVGFTRVLWGHTAQVTGLAAVASRAVSASRDGEIRVWCLESGECLHVVNTPHRNVVGSPVSDDARFVVSASRDHTLQVWCVATGACVCSVRGYTERASSSSVSGTHDVLLLLHTDPQGGVRTEVRRLSTGAYLGSVAGGRGAGVALSPCGRYVFSPGTEGVCVSAIASLCE